MNPILSYLHNFFFTVYPYICLSVFFLGSLARFDRDQYSWKSDSSQMLRTGTLRWGSNLFHIGILFLFFGHLMGLLTPHGLYEVFVSAADKQRMAIYSGGAAGVLCFIGLSLLLHRRLSDPRIRHNSQPGDIAILILLWLQLVIGLITIPFSFAHSDASAMLILGDWAQRIVTFRPNADALLALDWPFLVHLVLGMTLFLVFPFTRLVHVWSGFGTVGFLFRSPQVVRSRRLNLPADHKPGV